MAKFKRLTWGDLDNLTRDELVLRLEAEQKYWARMEKRGLNDADREARQQFSDMVFKVLDPAALADSMAETTAWIKGERATDSPFWRERPGRTRPTTDRAT